MKKGSLICADLYKNIIYDYTDGYIAKEKNRVNKSKFCACYIEAKSLSTLRYKYDKTGNLHNKIITYAYEELLLDPAKEYKISYFKNNDDSYMIYVIDVQKALNNINQNLQKSLKNINIIIPSPLLMSGFYAGRLLNKSGVDCYIFFDENESYVSFYKDGEYIFFHLIISDTLASIARQNNLEYKAEIIDQNIDKFSQLIDATIQTIQSIINIDRITPDRVFLSSFIGDLKGLSLTISKALNKSINGFDFLAKFGSFTPINLMLAIYVKELLYRDNGLNFRLLDKPEPLYKRADGKLFISLAAGVILGIIYPIYMLILAFSLDMNSKDFGANLSLQNSNADNLNKNLMIINKEIEKIDKDIQNIKNHINTKLSKIDSIATKISDHNLAIVLTNIAKSMQNYSLQARDIKLNSNKITIAIVSQNTQNINSFIKIFKDNASISQIISNKNLFESNITIGL